MATLDFQALSGLQPDESQGNDISPQPQSSPSTADPPLARRSAPIVPGESPSAPPLPLPPSVKALRCGSLGGAPPGGSPSASSASSAAVGRGGYSPLPATAELTRRLRGLMASAVNFRDVELMPARSSLEEELGELSLDQAEETDADAATGSAPQPPPLAPALSASASGGGGGAWGPAGVSGGGVERVGSAGSIGSRGSGGGGEADGVPGVPPGGRRAGGALVRKNKLVIIMVGLPGRGKTFLCNKLCCYLNWLGHATRHFNVGQYRRRQRTSDTVQDATFFDHSNEDGLKARTRAVDAALDDLMAWLRSDAGQVAVFDATNTTQARRELLRSKFHGVWQYLFIETICSDPAVLEQNYRNKMIYSPDYEGVDIDQAVSDFLARIAKYEEVYEPINDRTLHYIKLIDMVTGRGHMDINRISGYLPGKIVFFLMQVCKAGLTSARRIWLTRHGESEYNQRGLIGGNSSLSERGEQYARQLPEALVARLPQDQPVSVAVWTSTLKRTIETARFLPFPKLRWKALDEINAGICDGLTYEQIGERYPAEYEARKKDKLRYRYPAGESYMDVIQRVEPVIIELEREREYVVVVAHQAILRAVYAYFMGVAPEEIPRLSMPLHTLIELTPMPDGTMNEARFPVDVDGRLAMLAAEAAAVSVPRSLAYINSGSGSDIGAAAAMADGFEGLAAGGVGDRSCSSVESEACCGGGAGGTEAGGPALPASPAPSGGEVESAAPGVVAAEAVVAGA